MTVKEELGLTVYLCLIMTDLSIKTASDFTRLQVDHLKTGKVSNALIVFLTIISFWVPIFVSFTDYRKSVLDYANMLL